MKEIILRALWTAAWLGVNGYLVLGSEYKLVVDNEDVFTDCKDKPEYKGVRDMFDLTNIKMDFDDDIIHLGGSGEVIWKVDNTDRIESKITVFKLERGKWRPTVMTFTTRDICKILWMQNSDWFKSWGKYVHVEDRKCFNNLGHVFHHEDFDLDMRFPDLKMNDFEGHYKVEIIFHAYDKMGARKPDAICTTIVGDLVEV